jgi:hypothetical protein
MVWLHCKIDNLNKLFLSEIVSNVVLICGFCLFYDVLVDVTRAQYVLSNMVNKGTNRKLGPKLAQKLYQVYGTYF